ncbi:hypothetical protein ACJX0J_029838, partial [Zea mays]
MKGMEDNRVFSFTHYIQFIEGTQWHIVHMFIISAIATGFKILRFLCQRGHNLWTMYCRGDLYPLTLLLVMGEDLEWWELDRRVVELLREAIAATGFLHELKCLSVLTPNDHVMCDITSSIHEYAPIAAYKKQMSCIVQWTFSADYNSKSQIFFSVSFAST